MVEKSIKFQYYRVFELRGNDEIPYDLNRWVKRMYRLDYEQRTEQITADGIKCRVEEITPLASIDSNFIAMRFMKLDAYNIPKISNNLQSKPIDLEDDEYVGTDVNIIYHQSMQIMLIQKNRGSLTIPNLEQYLTQTAELLDGSLIKLRPIFDKDGIDDRKSITYKKFEVKFANLKKYKSQDSKNFGQVLSCFNNYEGNKATISISLGHTKKGETLNVQAMRDSISEIVNSQGNSNLFSDAVIHYTDEDDRSQIYDLFDNIVFEIIRFSLNPREELGFEYAVNTMGECFKEKLPKLYRVLQLTP